MKHARFVAFGASYSHGVRPEITEAFATGTRVLVRGLEAQFAVSGIKPYEIEEGVTRLQIHGLPEDSIEGGVVPANDRMSVFDTEAAQKLHGWSDDDVQVVLDTLRASDRNGLDFVEVASPKRPAPWSGYDKLTSAKKIAELTLDTGTEPLDVIKYEQENEDREEVLAALYDLLGDDVEEDITIDAT